MKKKMISAFLILTMLLSACSGASKSAAPDNGVIPDEAPMEQSDAGYESEPATDDIEISESEWLFREESHSDSEQYLQIVENQVVPTSDQSLFTFSLKVDTAAYNNVERYIENGGLPPVDAVKTEEMINYFSYDGEMNFRGNEPFAISTEIGPSPFDEHNILAFVRVKARDIDKSRLPSSNLTFLIDTSGSMDTFDKLPLLKTAFGLLVETLTADDRVSIVTYAGSSQVVLDGVSGDDKTTILKAIGSLSAGGSTAGAEGILTAYRLAEKNFMKSGNNRVILATDGDFNVGVSSPAALEKLISEKRDSGVYLSIMGFGTGNLKDDTMETLSKNGNGNYAYIHSVRNAEKVLVDELSANLFTIADDVKAQIECNPRNVKSYRLVGYENRALKNEDFENDTKDAGEIGVGTDVVIMFELEPQNTQFDSSNLKYAAQDEAVANDDDNRTAYDGELFEVRLRYKNPGESESKLITQPVTFDMVRENNSTDFQFASAVAGFGHLLRNSSYLGDMTIDDIIPQAKENLGRDAKGYRFEFVKMLERYKRIIE